MNYVFSTSWRNLDVQGVKSKFVDGVLTTSDEQEAEKLRNNKSVIEITQAFNKPEESKPEKTDAEKVVDKIRKRKSNIIVGARTVQEKEQ